MNARQMHERVLAIEAAHRHEMQSGLRIRRPSVCDECFLLDAIRAAVARAWDPFTNTPVAQLNGPVR